MTTKKSTTSKHATPATKKGGRQTKIESAGGARSTKNIVKNAGSQSNGELQARQPSRSMGKKQLARAAALTQTDAPHLTKAPVAAFDGQDFERLPQISAVSGSALQADIAELNKAVIRVLKTAARMGGSEPLAPMLLGTSRDMIDLFFNPTTGERLLAQSLGFPLVQLRIHDVGVMRQVIADGVVSSASVQSLTKTFPLEVVQAATRTRRGV